MFLNVGLVHGRSRDSWNVHHCKVKEITAVQTRIDRRYLDRDTHLPNPPDQYGLPPPNEQRHNAKIRCLQA